jgi:hypothetical protein
MIKRIIIVFLLCFSSLLSAQSRVEYLVSLVGVNMDYKEYDNAGTLLDSEKSHMNEILGAEFSYRFYLDQSDRIDFNCMGSYGYSSYVGSYLEDDKGYGSVTSRTYNTLYDLSLYYNNLEISKIALFDLVGGLGVGYRFWNRELSTIQVEQYSWFSLRAKVGLAYHQKNFSITPTIAYEFGINPKMDASGFQEEFKLSSADIMKFSLPIQYKLSEHLDFYGSYVFEYQKIQESNVLYGSNQKGYIEPDSKASNQYIKIGIVFKY